MPKQTSRQIQEGYEIVAEAGEGGMARVYRAVQKSLNRHVAIKELKKAYHADGRIVQRFEREAAVSASLQHENIVHIYNYWKKPAFCIVMEYVDGVTLARLMEKTGALPADIGIMIALQVCDALDYAHMHGVVHRDVKPGNIMIKRTGEVKLMDFGIARPKSLEGITTPGTLLGTPAYMSPEQVAGRDLDARSDIFSFGIVLYEMFTGTKPFTDDETGTTGAKIVKGLYRSPRSVNHHVPRGLQRVIRKCLRTKPHRRYRSMQEVGKKLGKRLAGRTTKPASLHRIAEYLVAQGAVEAAPDVETVRVTVKRSRAGLYRKALIAVFAALVLATGTFLYSIRENRPTAPRPAAPPAAPAPQGGAELRQKSEQSSPAKKKPGVKKKKKKKKTSTSR